MGKRMAKAWRIVRLPVAAYLGVCLVLWWFENSMVFRPTTAQQDWQPAPIAEIEDVELTSGDGTRIHAWYCPHPTAKSAVLYCHGNAGNLSQRGGSIVKLRDILQASILIFDYPGYGKSGGRPTEKGCYLAADAGYQWLTVQKGHEGREVLLFGASLGGAVAMDLAARQPCKAVVLVKAFTSAPDVGAGMFPWLPIRWLMRNRFDNLQKVAACQVPIFIVHGDADSVVPYAHGLRLFDAAKEPKAFLPLPGHEHNDALPPEFFVALTEFLAKHRP